MVDLEVIDALLDHPTIGVVVCQVAADDLVVELANEAALTRLGPAYAPGRRLGLDPRTAPLVPHLLASRSGRRAIVDLAGSFPPVPGSSRIASVTATADRVVLVIEGVGGDRDVLGRWNEAMLDAAVDVIFVLDQDGTIRHASPGAWTLLDFEPGALVGADFRSFVDGRDRLVVEEAFLELLRLPPHQPLDLEWRLVDGRGITRWVNVRSVNRLGVPGVEAIVSSLRDITVQRNLRTRLEHAATHDPLTGLANRALLTDHLQLALATAARQPGGWIGVVFLDLDRFKAVNDSFGHPVGDELLRRVAERLTDAVRPTDTVARFGGDEFAVLCQQVPSVHEVLQLADRVLHAVTGNYDLAGAPHEVFVSASVGVSVSDEPGADADNLLREADTALYEAKRLGRGGVQLYTARLRHSVGARLTLETALRAGIERGELEVRYQPKLDLRSGLVHDVEALVRWHHPDRGLLSPVAFLDVADETGLLVPIGRWVLREALAQSAAWRAEGLDLGVCVNVSARELAQPGLVDALVSATRDLEVPPAQLQLEITEQAAVADLAAAIRLVEQVRALGMRVALDDFGTGYSSLAWLQRIPVDTIKLDRSFIVALDTAEDSAPIVAAILQLAAALGLASVAEGVESAPQLRRLRELGCGAVQGYLLAPPMPGDELAGSGLPLRRA